MSKVRNPFFTFTKKKKNIPKIQEHKKKQSETENFLLYFYDSTSAHDGVLTGESLGKKEFVGDWALIDFEGS